MRAAVTPWFKVDVKPMREGVYQTKIYSYGAKGFSHFDGKKFGNQYPTKNAALMRGSGGIQEKSWRGLASDPKASKP